MAVILERQLQNKVIQWLIEKEENGGLGYEYLGNLEDQNNNSVKEDLLRKYLNKKSYTKEQIDSAVNELITKSKNQVNNLYQNNKEIYSLLRYGLQGAKDTING